MKLPSKRDAVRIRGLLTAVGLLLFGVSLAGALQWITLGDVDQLALGASILIFIIVGWSLSSWLRHIEE